MIKVLVLCLIVLTLLGCSQPKGLGQGPTLELKGDQPLVGSHCFEGPTVVESK